MIHTRTLTLTHRRTVGTERVSESKCYTATMDIDLDGILHELGVRAAKGKTKRARFMRGLIKVIVAEQVSP